MEQPPTPPPMTTTSARVFTRATLPQLGGRLDAEPPGLALVFRAQRFEELAQLVERDRSGRRRLARSRLARRSRRLGPPGQHRAIVAGGGAPPLVALTDARARATRARPRASPARRSSPSTAPCPAR